MFKKLLVTLCITLTACLVNAADVTNLEDDFLADVQELSENQMAVVTGEDIEIIEYEIVYGHEYVLRRQIIDNPSVGGYIKINVRTGEVEQHIYPINQ